MYSCESLLPSWTCDHFLCSFPAGSHLFEMHMLVARLPVPGGGEEPDLGTDLAPSYTTTSDEKEMRSLFLLWTDEAS